LIEHTPGAPEPTGAPTTVGVELLPCAALTLNVLALTAQSETSMMAAMATLKKIRLCFIHITVFRWRAVIVGEHRQHADAAATGAFSKVVTNMPIPYKGCRNVFWHCFNSLEPHFYKLVLIVKRAQSLPCANAALPVPVLVAARPWVHSGKNGDILDKSLIMLQA